MRKLFHPLRVLLLIMLLATLFGASCTLIEPAVTIESPEDGTSLPEGNVNISVDVSNFELVDKMGQPNEEGEGHIYYYMDVDPPTTPGDTAATDRGSHFATSDTSYTWTDVPQGTHTFAVQLVNNDHTVLDPAATDTIEVSVERPARQ